MKKFNTSDRLEQLIQLYGYKQIDIVKKATIAANKFNEIYKTNIKFGRNDISQYVNGKVEPNQYKLQVLSEALGVSPVWLMGYDVPMEVENEINDEEIVDSEIINNLKNYILKKLASVDNEKKKEILDQLGWTLMSIAKEMK